MICNMDMQDGARWRLASSWLIDRSIGRRWLALARLAAYDA